MPTTVRPFLMFEGKAEEAMNLYVALFKDGRVLEISKFGPEGPGAEGSVHRASFSVGGQTVMCFDSPVKHQFGFTPSFSLFVDCESEGELRRLVAALGEGGATLMPVNNYGFSRLFGWVADRYGVSWQLNLP